MDRIEQRCRGQLDTLRGTAAALEDIAVTVSSPSDVLRVRLNGACTLTGLDLTTAALRLGDRLGPLIVDTCAVAAREVGRQRAQIMTEFHEEFDREFHEDLPTG